MCRCSRNSEGGRVTDALPMLACPGPGVTVAFNEGNLPRLVPPRKRKSIFGLKAREEQKETWNGLVTVAVESSAGLENVAPEPFRVEVTPKCSQLVGLTMKSGLSMKTRTSRRCRGMPSMMWGIGSEPAESSATWALWG